MRQNDIILLLIAAVGIGLMGVVIDRLNFPQKKFRPKTVALSKKNQRRDRTGSHITEFAPQKEDNQSE